MDMKQYEEKNPTPIINKCLKALGLSFVTFQNFRKKHGLDSILNEHISWRTSKRRVTDYESEEDWTTSQLFKPVFEKLLAKLLDEKFTNGLDEILKKLSLPKAYRFPLARFLLFLPATGIYPRLPEIIHSRDEVTGEPILSVRIHPDTTSEDIENFWSSIAEAKQHLWGQKRISRKKLEFSLRIFLMHKEKGMSPKKIADVLSEQPSSLSMKKHDTQCDERNIREMLNNFPKRLAKFIGIQSPSTSLHRKPKKQNIPNG